jgi:two-component system chemotaxis response regulator CheB
MIRVLIVDDSALMRKHLTGVLEATGEFAVRAARNGTEALAALAAEPFDVVTLDINMPVMDGLTCLSRIMADDPKPVVMVSSLTREGAEATFEALSLGAVDYVQKPDGTISLSIDQIERELVAKVRAAARARPRRAFGLRSRILAARQSNTASARAQRKTSGPDVTGHSGLILIGVSTGGPGTLEQILPRLSPDLRWPVVIAQHMPGAFTGPFARRMDGLCELNVVEVERSMPLEPGTVYIARGDADLVVSRRGGSVNANPMPASRAHVWHPSVELMVRSALSVLPADRLVGIELTGMGDDGAAAMAELHRRGGLTIAQDEESSIVFGMPQELIRLGGATHVMSSDLIAGQLNQWFARDGGRGRSGGRTHAG